MCGGGKWLVMVARPCHTILYLHHIISGKSIVHSVGWNKTVEHISAISLEPPCEAT